MEFLGQSYLQNDTNLIGLREITYFNIYNENPSHRTEKTKNKKTKQNKIRALKNKKMVKVYPANITYSNSTIETLDIGVKFVQSSQQKHQNEVSELFHTFFYCWLLTSKC